MARLSGFRIPHLTKTTSAGLAFLVAGFSLLGASLYLYDADFQFDQKMPKMPLLTNSAYMCCIQPQPPYSNVQPHVTIIGSILIGIGAFLISYKQIQNRMRVK